MQDGARAEALPELVAQPFEVTSVGAVRGGARLDLDPDDVTRWKLRYEVDLVTTIARA